MPNYGHALQLGALIDARAQGQHAPAAADLAVRAEELGLDLAIFHEPGDVARAQSGNAVPHAEAATDETGALDPWVLATWAAGRTERITLAAAGLTAGTRSPAVLARAAGSLSLFSGGRAALALAADRDEAAEVTDAVAVLRAMADTASDQVTHPGTHHAVAGAQPGPVLDREVPLWLNGSDEQAARLAGAIADGLLVDLDTTAGPDALDHLNAVIDEAATSYGRDPREIRRLVILPGDAASTGPGAGGRHGDLQSLVSMVLDHGVSGILLRQAASPSSAALEHFAEQAVPALRQAVSEALPELGTQRIRRAAVRARRHPGIDYEAIPRSLVDSAVEPGDAAYARVKSTYMRGGAPGLVLRPGNAREVADAIDYARGNPHLELGVRSGGHGISGRSTNQGGLVIDVGAMNTVEVLDESERLVRLGPGARWRDVARVLQGHGWSIGSGDYGGVGVGGLITAGGLGFLSRNHGLTIDNLHAADLVLADGSMLRASATQNPEVFWALRGAGANIGIVTSVEVTASPVGEVGWAQLAFQTSDVAGFLTEFGRVATSAPRQTTAFLIMGPPRGGTATAQVMAMVDSADPDTVISQLQPFAQIPTMVGQQVVIAPYAAVMNMFPEQPHQGRGEPVSRSALFNEITTGFAGSAARLLDSGSVGWFQLRTMGGAIGDVPADATAFPHRGAVMHVTAMGANAQRVDRAWEPLRAHADGLYLSFETDRSPQRLVDAFGAQGLSRLRRLKAQVDPHHLFTDNFAIRSDRAPQGVA